MVLDATTPHAKPLTPECLFAWQAALFPMGYVGLTKITTGAWRNDAHRPMQVVSGLMTRQRGRFEAPPADRLMSEVSVFLHWLNDPRPSDPALGQVHGVLDAVLLKTRIWHEL